MAKKQTTTILLLAGAAAAAYFFMKKKIQKIAQKVKILEKVQKQQKLMP